MGSGPGPGKAEHGRSLPPGPSPEPPAPRFEVITDLDRATLIADDWDDLARRTPGSSYFSTPHWALAWWRCYGSGSEVEVATWRDATGRLEAVVALVGGGERLHRRLPARLPVWGNLGSRAGSADHCSWPCLPERAADARAWLGERAGQRSMLLRSLDPELGVPLVPAHGVCVSRIRCPRMAVGAGEPIGSSGKFRKRLRYLSRRLADAGVGFRWLEPSQMSESVLETLYRLHERRHSQGGPPSVFERDRLRFLSALGGSARPGCGPAATLAEIDGRVVGILYGFLWEGTFAYYQGGWEPEWAAESLGTMVVAEAMRLAGASGVTVFDFLRGAEEYKYRFGASDRVDETWLVPRGVAGGLLQAKHRAATRLAPAVPASDAASPN